MPHGGGLCAATTLHDVAACIRPAAIGAIGADPRQQTPLVGHAHPLRSSLFRRTGQAHHGNMYHAQPCLHSEENLHQPGVRGKVISQKSTSLLTKEAAVRRLEWRLRV